MYIFMCIYIYIYIHTYTVPPGGPDQRLVASRQKEKARKFKRVKSHRRSSWNANRKKSLAASRQKDKE